MSTDQQNNQLKYEDCILYALDAEVLPNAWCPWADEKKEIIKINK